MGIRHLVFAVNKMDLVDYDQDVFDKIRKDIRHLVAEFEYDTLSIIPVSATIGDNITQSSSKLSWYQGPALLSYLERIDVNTGHDDVKGFILPVQRVCRPNRTFRGFEGEIAEGFVSVGDTIEVLPSGEHAKISGIYLADKEVSRAEKGNPVTVTLNSEIDVSRGCVITKGFSLNTGSEFVADILWMDETNLVEGRNYYLKLGTQTVPATVTAINHQIDVNTGEEIQRESITKNELASCDIMVGNPIVFSDFRNSRELGAFILIDRVTFATSACGVIRRAKKNEKNLTWHQMDVTRSLREGTLGQKAKTLWFTGLSGAGKSTIANALEKRLFALGKHTMLLDGDNVRMGLNKNLGFDEADRSENIRRIAEVSKLMNDAGLIVITSFISPLRVDRRNAKEIIGDSYKEIYIATSIEECERRDVKGLYKKAKNGDISNFTGISSPYEIPDEADIVLDTEKLSVDECVEAIIEMLKEEI